jgi:small subunit ribosomal protein S9
MAKGRKYDVHAIGRRKSSVARVYMVKGQGKILVNNRDYKEYFPLGTQQYVVNQPLNLMKAADGYDVVVNVKGGGTSGQAGAIRLGISRALLKLDEKSRPELKEAGFLTRDSRKVERKKYGLSGARKSYQFSKR